MSSPYDPAPTSIPVTVLAAGAVPPSDPGATLLRLQPPLHQHEPGSECVACAARHDIRARLFDLLQQSRQPGANPLSSVIVDATARDDAEAVAERLAPGAAAFGMRDFTVVRSFHLSRVIGG